MPMGSFDPRQLFLEALEGAEQFMQKQKRHHRKVWIIESRDWA